MSRGRRKSSPAGLTELEPYADAAAVLERLTDERVRLAALTNGGAQKNEELLKRAKLLDRFERTCSAADVHAYRPDRRTYAHAVEQLEIAPAEATLIAAHAWDVVGALAAGQDAI